MKMIDDVIIIGIDSGYGNIKTANCCFPASVSTYAKEPVFKENLLVYESKFYLIGEGHKEFLADKTRDLDYYVLALAAIARELNIRKKQLEDAEIIKSIRSMKLNSRELLVVLDKIQNGTAVFPYLTEETTVPDTKKKRIGRILQKKENCRDIGQKKRRMNIVRMKIKKWLAAFTVAAGMVLPATTAFAFTDEAAQQAVEAPAPTETPVQEEEPPKTEETPFSVPGNGSLADDKSGDSTKEFLTVQTKNGNTFFLVLDRSSNKENVYMLSMIDEDDLAEFVTETKKQETEQPTVITPQPETKPAVEETEKEPEKESKETNTGALLAIALLAVAGCGGVYYFKVVKPKKEEEDAGDEDLEFYEGDYINEDSENHMDEDDTEE